MGLAAQPARELAPDPLGAVVTPLCQMEGCDAEGTWLCSVVSISGAVLSFDASVMLGPSHRCTEHMTELVPARWDHGSGEPTGLYVERA